MNLLPSLAADEKVNAMLPVKEYSDDRYVFFATRQGVVKKTPLSRLLAPAQRSASGRSNSTRATAWSTWR